MRSLIVPFLFVLFGCNGCREHHSSAGTDPQTIQQQLIEENRRKHQQETERIRAFIAEKQWPMTETGTGLQYWIYEKGEGKRAKEGDVVVLTYTVHLLDGTALYSADESRPGRFLIGQDNVESGLHEAMQLMSVGDRARFVLPSHLAFGFTGDADKVPQDASLVYDIHLLSLE